MLVYFVYIVGTLCVSAITGTNARRAVFELQYDINKVLNRLLASSKLQNMKGGTTDKTNEPVIKLHSFSFEKNAIKQKSDEKNNMEELNYRRISQSNKETKRVDKRHKNNGQSRHKIKVARKVQGKTEINGENQRPKEKMDNNDKFEINFNETHMKVKIDLQTVMKNLSWLRAQDLDFNYRHFKTLENKKNTNNALRTIMYTDEPDEETNFSKKITKRVKTTSTVNYAMGRERPHIYSKSQKFMENIKNMESELKKRELSYKGKKKEEKKEENTEAEGRKANEEKEKEERNEMLQNTKNIQQEPLKEKKSYTDTSSTSRYLLQTITRGERKKETAEPTKDVIKEETKITVTQTPVNNIITIPENMGITDDKRTQTSQAQTEMDGTTEAANLRGSNAAGVQNDIDKLLNSLLASSKLLEITESIANKVIEQVVKLRTKLISRKAINNDIHKKVDLREALKGIRGRGIHEFARPRTGYTETLTHEEDAGQAASEKADKKDKLAINENETNRIVQIDLQDIMKNLTQLRAQDLSFNYRHFKVTNKTTQPSYKLSNTPEEIHFDFKHMAMKEENIAETEIPKTKSKRSTEDIERNAEEIDAELKPTQVEEVNEGEKVQNENLLINNSLEKEDNFEEGITTTEESFLRIVTYDDITEEKIKENVESVYAVPM